MQLETIALNIDDLIQKYKVAYSKNNKPIEISFREILPELNNQERYSHLMHSYPAKLLMHIPYFFLNNSYFSERNQIVLDPFCGTGTVLLEANLAGRKAIGADANPLARLIAKTKTKKYNINLLNKSLESLLKSAKRYKYGIVPDVKNINYWFPQTTIFDLGRLLRAIKEIKNKDQRDFFLVCLSNCVKKVSFADPRISVPVRLNPDRYQKDHIYHKKTKAKLKEIKNLDVFEKFKRICLENIIRSSKLKKRNVGVESKIISNDARSLKEGIFSKKRFESCTVDLIITSPPYAGAQKYIRASSLGLGWLELADTTMLKKLDEKNIGRELYAFKECKSIQQTGIHSADSLIKKIHKIDIERAKIASNYLVEMKDAIDESIRVLKTNGHIVLVIGNNQVCNYEFNTQEYLTSYLESKGLEIVFKLIDGIKSYGLMTKRNKTADIITREYILVFKKVKNG